MTSARGAERRPAAQDAGVLLRAEGLCKSFGGVHAVRDISLDVPAGAIFAIIGPNGAGKSTLLNLMSGIYRPDAGHVEVRRRRSHRHCRRIGACATASRARSRRSACFKQLSVLDNVVAGFHIHTTFRPGNTSFTGRRSGATMRAAARRRCACSPSWGSRSARMTLAGSLSYGEQRMLEIARALATAPRLLMIDEPAAGLNARRGRARCSTAS